MLCCRTGPSQRLFLLDHNYSYVKHIVPSSFFLSDLWVWVSWKVLAYIMLHCRAGPPEEACEWPPKQEAAAAQHAATQAPPPDRESMEVRESTRVVSGGIPQKGVVWCSLDSCLLLSSFFAWPPPLNYPPQMLTSIDSRPELARRPRETPAVVAAQAREPTLIFCCHGGSSMREKALGLSKLQWFLTSTARVSFVKIRTFKGFLTNKAPTNINKTCIWGIQSVH